MAKKTHRKVDTDPESQSVRRRRKRRSPDEIIADLQAEIKRVRDRARTRELKESPAIKQSIAAVRSLDKALDLAATEGDGRLRHALADARKTIAPFLEEMGVKLPRANLPKGPRPK